ALLGFGQSRRSRFHGGVRRLGRGQGCVVFLLGNLVFRDQLLHAFQVARGARIKRAGLLELGSGGAQSGARHSRSSLDRKSRRVLFRSTPCSASANPAAADSTAACDAWAVARAVSYSCWEISSFAISCFMRSRSREARVSSARACSSWARAALSLARATPAPRSIGKAVVCSSDLRPARLRPIPPQPIPRRRATPGPWPGLCRIPAGKSRLSRSVASCVPGRARRAYQARGLARAGLGRRSVWRAPLPLLARPRSPPPGRSPR